MIANELWPDRPLTEGDIQTTTREHLEARLRYLENLLVQVENWVEEHINYLEEFQEMMYDPLHYGCLINESEAEKLKTLLGVL